MNPQIWQIASGEKGRYYSDLFLKYDLMFLGPGRYGPYREEEYRHVVARGEYTVQKIGTVRAFLEDVRPGDIVLLREGLRVVEIGIVPEAHGDDGYRHDPAFDDVYGWDLEHTRRVCWQNLRGELEKMQAGTSGLFSARKQIATFTRVNEAAVCRKIKPLVARCATRPLKPRPDTVFDPLDREELGQALFSKGLPNDAVDRVLQAIERQRRLLKWYQAQGKASLRPDEHEVVAHMVLPLLLAMGWSEQLLAVEWKRIDLAAFWGTPTTAERCVLVCEAKGMRFGLQGVWEQAGRYIRERKLTGCRKILLTQGARFYLYDRPKHGWSEVESQPTGYVNLERIRTNHVAPPNTNAIDTLMALTPAGVQRNVGATE